MSFGDKASICSAEYPSSPRRGAWQYQGKTLAIRQLAGVGDR